MTESAEKPEVERRPRLGPLAAFAGSRLTRMLAARLVYGVVSLVVVSILVFAATEALPGSAAIAKLGKNATPAAVASFDKLYHLNEPLTTQYLHWVVNLLHGRLGVSLETGEAVGALIGHAVVNTFALTLVAMVIGAPLATALGIYTAIRRDRAGDHAISVGLLVLTALPEFVVGIVLVALFATSVFRVLPAVSPVDPTRSVFDQVNLLALPTLTLVLLVLPYTARTVRGCMIDVLESEYVTMARLKGVSEWRVILRHALPNIAGPTFQVNAQTLGYLAGGVVVVETVFQYPGVGLAFDSAISGRDIPVIQALGLMLAAFYIFVNVVADVGTAAMTPTMRRRAR